MRTPLALRWLEGAMFRSIAVTTDFSETSRQAFGPAAELARKLGARIRVIHLDAGPEIHMPWECVESSRKAREERAAEIEEKLEQLVTDEPAFDGLRVEPRLIQGEPADALPALHERERVDLLVLSSRAHEDVKHFVPGSFAARALHLARCPVLVLRSLPARKESLQFRRLLVPVDFSAPSLAAFEVASKLARTLGADLELLSVLEAPPGCGAAAPGGSGPPEGEADRRIRLEALIARTAGRAGARVVVRSGCAATELLAEAALVEADLIVMGSRGLSPVEQITLGSVAESAIQNAGCPVLVVKDDLAREPGQGRMEFRNLAPQGAPTTE
jgi:nucleotide-binding universal stress UspA family protein